MYGMNRLVAFLIFFACGSTAVAQGAKSAGHPTVSEIADRLAGNTERVFLRAADAMPENKYSFVPTSGEFKGVRTFLTGSFAYLHKALSSINERNETELIQSPDSEKPLSRLELADRALSHSWNHYGQMAEYLRMNGIVPPASRH